MPVGAKVTMSVEARMSNYYGLFFLSIGSVMPFIALWFDSLAISPALSGAIFAAPSIVIVLFTVVIGGWADRLSDWRTAIIVCNWIVLILFSWFLFRTNSWDILIVWTLAGLFTHASNPIMDAAALNLTKKRGSDFGRIRAIGSIGFIVGVVLAGWIFEQVGLSWFVPVVLAGAALRLIAAHALPRFKSADAINDNRVNGEAIPRVTGAAPSIAMEQSRSVGIHVLRHPGILWVIVGAALINASHGFNNVFAVLHWTKLEISTSLASVLWAVAVIAEVALMWTFRSVAKRFSARKCLVFAGVVCALRWLLSGFEPSLVQIFILQSLHAITFGLSFLAIVNFISRRVHENNAAQAQSVFATLVTAFMAVSTWLSGWLYEQFAGQSYWAMAVLALIGALCVLLSFNSDLKDPVAPE